MQTNDPIELIIADGLGRAGIRFVHESDNKSQALDFSLPDFGVYIECKQFPSERTSEQIAQFSNVIVIQGRGGSFGICQADCWMTEHFVG